MNDAQANPMVLVVRVSESCNAGCFMCGFARSQDSYVFSADDAQEASAWIGRSAIRLVRLTGGEPLLLRDVTGVVRALKEVDVAVSIITNGYYLEEVAPALAACGVDQVIVSIDGPGSSTHDRYRGLTGLYDRCTRGLSALKAAAPNVRTRVNTVVGPHNIKHMKQIYDTISLLEVDQWSIIPLKQEKPGRRRPAFDEFMETVVDFQNHVRENPGPVAMLGYSLTWAGANLEQARTLWEQRRCLTPAQQCHLVDFVRYYVPKEGMVYPCNCVPHREGNGDFGERWSMQALTGDGLCTARAWLKQFGPMHCRGCEPVNAALGDKAVDAETDPFLF